MPDNPEKSASPHPEKDRRLHARQRIHSLSYVKMGDANGGIVLNISEGGISVQAAAVLDASEPVTLWLEIPRVRNRVEVTAEIVWLSASKKEAGLRFVDLPESTLQQIRRWMAREASPEQFEDETDPVGEERDEPVEVTQGEDTEVRELAEANTVSTDERKSSESEHDSAGPPATATAEENEAKEDGEPESPVPDVAQIDADHWEDIEAEEDIEEESEPEVETEEVELHGKVHEEAETKAKVEIQDKSKNEDKSLGEKESQTEDELIQAFGPPVVPFERRPHTPFSSMNAIAGGSRSAQNLAVAPPLPRQIQKPVAEPAMPTEPPAESGWKVFRIQLQSGWFLAALVLLLALISFIAGMAVRRGALNNVLGEQQDTLIPKSSTAPGAISHTTPPASGDGADGTNVPPAKPLSIEIVDVSDHRWVIPASSGANHANATVTTEASGTPPASDGANHVKTADAGPEAQGPSQPSAKAGGSGSAVLVNPGKTGVPLVLSLPETPISATGSVAISSQRSVPVPADGSKAAQNGRSLQVGQLINLVEPVYPAEAVQQKIEGTVKLHAVIGTDGVIESLAQVSGPQVLVNASMTAVRNWRYSPTRMNGQPIETQEDISFVFRLPN